jgi:hypothetical protein
VAARVLFAIPPPEGIIINLAIIIVSSGTLAMTIVVHELWHWHQPQLHLMMMGSPQLQKHHPNDGMGGSGTQPLVLWN